MKLFSRVVEDAFADVIKGICMSKFNELATFNSDKDKTKYNTEYLKKMEDMQIEYNERLEWFATSNGYIVLKG